MRVAVCVKHAIDESELKTDSVGNPLLAGAASKMSTFDKNALEEAVRIKSAKGGEVVVFTVGSLEAKKTLKEALAMGGDRGVHVLAESGTTDSFGTARLLASAIRRAGNFDLVMCSEGSSDTYTGLVPPMLGELLSLPYVGYARRIELTADRARVEQSLEEIVQTVESPLPLVVSVVSEINEPRYPTLIQIMQASKKPIEEVASNTLGSVEPSPGKVGVLSMKALAMNRKRIIIEGSPEETARKLVDALASEGLIPK